MTEPSIEAASAESQVEIEIEPPIDTTESPEADSVEPHGDATADVTDHEQDSEPLDVKLERITLEDEPSTSAESSASHNNASTQAQDGPIYEDPSDEDDGEGEWITPSNVTLHKSRALHLVPDENAKGGKGKTKVAEQIRAGCMTADFAMQNVLLQMGLSLVGVEGKKIDRVKTWVLRCHACFK